jgi:shikimate dehydrogenase
VHNRVYEMLDLDYAYVPFDVPDVGAALDAVRSLGIRGAAISIPYKEAAVPHLDEVDDTSAKIGAVNSVRNDAGRLVGFNTDVSGAMAALAEVGGVPGARVALIGAGGSARAIAYGLQAEGCGPVHVFNRTIERGERLVRELDLEGAHGLSDPRLVRECDIVINATSVGLGESDASPISEDCLREGQIVFDIVYHPRDTRLLRAARSAGSRVVYGERMLLHGVAHQIAFFTGVEPQLSVVETALQAAS